MIVNYKIILAIAVSSLAVAIYESNSSWIAGRSQATDQQLDIKVDPEPAAVVASSELSKSVVSAPNLEFEGHLNYSAAPSDSGRGGADVLSSEVILHVDTSIEPPDADDDSVLNPFALSDHDTEASSIPSRFVARPDWADARGEARNMLDGKFAEVAMDDDHGESPGVVSTEFAFSPLPGTRHVPNPAGVNTLDTAYAHITSTEKCATCIVKWQHQDSGDVQMLVTANLLPHKPHTLYLTPEGGWRVGQYVMSVYDAAGPVRLLGRNSIQILDVRTASKPVEPEVEFIQDLLSDGRAVSKLPRFLVDDPSSQTTVPNHAYIQSLLDSGQAVFKIR